MTTPKREIENPLDTIVKRFRRRIRGPFPLYWNGLTYGKRGFWFFLGWAVIVDTIIIVFAQEGWDLINDPWAWLFPIVGLMIGQATKKVIESLNTLYGVFDDIDNCKWFKKFDRIKR